MPWEITIRKAGGAILGDLHDVRQHIVDALPAVKFVRESSGMEKIAFARAKGIEFPEVLRKHFEQQPAKERAEIECNGLSVILYGFETQPLVAIHVEVRGEGNPIPVLSALCRPYGWEVIDDTNAQRVDLSGVEAKGWEAFQAYRSGAMQNIKES